MAELDWCCNLKGVFTESVNELELLPVEISVWVFCAGVCVSVCVCFLDRKQKNSATHPDLSRESVYLHSADHLFIDAALIKAAAAATLPCDSAEPFSDV